MAGFDGERLKELRVKRKLSQEALGAKVGRSKSVICSYETNAKVPPLEILIELADYFGVTLDYMAGREMKEMVSVDGLTKEQRDDIYMLLQIFRDEQERGPGRGLTIGERGYINTLLEHFNR